MDSVLKMSLVIQAGGESRRMGSDKALVSFLGQPLIVRVLNRLANIADEVMVTSNKPDVFAFFKIPVVKDLIPGQGSLSGLYTALSIAHYPLVAVVACDMPFASRELLVAERQALEKSLADGAIPQTESGFEPFHAIYRKEPCLKWVYAALKAGKKRAYAWFPDVNLIFFTPERIRQYDPSGQAFININTPEELCEAEKFARQAIIMSSSDAAATV
jgi:molybdopterin-guanine dinucleotide biosynthesis protein A